MISKEDIKKDFELYFETNKDDMNDIVSQLVEAESSEEELNMLLEDLSLTERHTSLNRTKELVFNFITNFDNWYEPDSDFLSNNEINIYGWGNIKNLDKILGNYYNKTFYPTTELSIDLYVTVFLNENKTEILGWEFNSD